jgi:hypothetical protein
MEDAECSEGDSDYEIIEDHATCSSSDFGAEADDFVVALEDFDAGRRRSAGSQYRVISKDDVKALQVKFSFGFDCGIYAGILKHEIFIKDEASREVMALLGCSPSAAKCVLMHYRWNKEKLASKGIC